MKKNLLSIGLFLTTASLFAQIPSLTNSSMPIIGDISTYYAADTLLGPGTIGAGQTWNFGTMQITNTPNTVTYVTPAGTPAAASFPTATVALQDGGGNYNYFELNGSTFSLLGTYTVVPQTVPFNDAEKLFTLPFTFGSSLSDNFGANYVTNGVNQVRTGNRNTTGSGSGTLILPSGTYNNVLQVKVVEHWQDDSNNGGFTITFTSDITTYEYYDAAHKTPICTFSSIDIQSSMGGNPGPMVHSKSVSVASFAVGVKENSDYAENKFNILPNPSINETFVSYNLTAKADVLVTILNTLGQSVKATTFKDSQPGQHKESINIEGLETGIYFINIQYDNYSFTKKLIVK